MATQGAAHQRRGLAGHNSLEPGVFYFGVRGHGKIRLASAGLIHPRESTLSAIGIVTKNAVIGALKGSKAKTAQAPLRPSGRSMATNRKSSENRYYLP